MRLNLEALKRLGVEGDVELKHDGMTIKGEVKNGHFTVTEIEFDVNGLTALIVAKAKELGVDAKDLRNSEKHSVRYEHETDQYSEVTEFTKAVLLLKKD